MTDAVVRAGYLGGPRGRCVRMGSHGGPAMAGIGAWGGCGVRCVRIGSHSDWVHDLPLAVSGRAACPVRRQSRALPVSSASNPTPPCRTPPCRTPPYRASLYQTPPSGHISADTKHISDQQP